MSPRQRWKGELARPIRFAVNRPHGFAVPDPATDPEAESKTRAENELMVLLRDDERAKAESAKLELLAKYYGVPPNDFRASLLALARDVIPGFQFKDPLRKGENCGPQYDQTEKMGRPVEWSFDRLGKLLEEVDALGKGGNLTNREALARLARKKEWRPPANHRGDRDTWLETLESRLQDAKKFRKMFDSALQSLRECERRNSGNSEASC
jgi:hypothetical protein